MVWARLSNPSEETNDFSSSHNMKGINRNTPNPEMRCSPETKAVIVKRIEKGLMLQGRRFVITRSPYIHFILVAYLSIAKAEDYIAYPLEFGTF